MSRQGVNLRILRISVLFLLVLPWTHGCKSCGDSRGVAIPAGSRLPRSERTRDTVSLDCGEYFEYENTSESTEGVDILAINDCEFTAYLWIIPESGEHTLERIPPATIHSEHYWLEPHDKFELECTLVDQSKPGGCSLTYTVNARK